jgi:hypothetical protein
VLWAGIAIVAVAVLISILGAIWVGVPALLAGLILVGVALVRTTRRTEPVEPPT